MLKPFIKYPLLYADPLIGKFKSTVKSCGLETSLYLSYCFFIAFAVSCNTVKTPEVRKTNIVRPVTVILFLDKDLQTSLNKFHIFSPYLSSYVYIINMYIQL
ncbi:Hypothetical protein MCYN_0879 [Mycoplasmopsis cynos C142]|uniref:Uncharacterized protein n=1 Tax=Mycoplasmopsis cynos (strain C142) TaxID=1246955 RepID=L0RYK0_MYCC1|nr:Hypothetical protein MCYN_0879 [Mycoplasmopsis cynos C142]